MQDIVAAVNGQPITHFDLETTIQEYALQLNGQTMDKLSDEELANLNRTALEKLIVWELIFQASGQQEVVIDEKVVIEETEGLVALFSSKEVFLKKLDSQGISVEELRHSVHKDLVAREIMNRMVAESPEPVQADIEGEYQSYLESREGEGHLSQEDATPKIREFLKEKAGISRLRQWVEELRAQATVEIRNFSG